MIAAKIKDALQEALDPPSFVGKDLDKLGLVRLAAGPNGHINVAPRVPARGRFQKDCPVQLLYL